LRTQDLDDQWLAQTTSGRHPIHYSSQEKFMRGINPEQVSLILTVIFKLCL
jgi:hypothetical protein